MASVVRLFIFGLLLLSILSLIEASPAKRSTKRKTTSTKRHTSTSTKKVSTTAKVVTTSKTSTTLAKVTTSSVAKVTSTTVKTTSTTSSKATTSTTTSSTSTSASATATPTFTSTSAWKVLYQNDADWTKALSPATRQTSFLLYSGKVTGANVNAVCASMNETPVSVSALSIDAGLQSQLQYLLYDGTYSSSMSFWVQNSSNSTVICPTILATSSSAQLGTQSCNSTFPVLCTNSAPRSTAANASNNSTYAIKVNGLTAYRDAFSFRFMQIPFANTPVRFAKSSVYYPSQNTGPVPGTSSQCPQLSNAYGEDCLVANIYTPVISNGTNPIALKPIMMWVYGGGFTSGSGQDPTFDGGSMASRGDVIVITPNYRLGTFGFMSLNSAVSGNWAVSDLVTALNWIQINAATFGGDPTKVTIFGQSAGAQLVETLLASPAASGLFSRAIIQSGRPADDANKRLSLAVAQAGPAATTLTSLGCANNTGVLTCLRGLTTAQVLKATQFSKIVVDNKFVTQPNMDVAKLRNGYINKVPVMMGFMRDEMGSLGYAPPLSQTSLDAALTAGGISSHNRSVIEGNTTLFPVPSGSNGIQNLTVTVETDSTSVSRCGQESTIYSAASTGVFNGIWAYTQDQRSYQIQGYDPNSICTSTTSATSGYFLCHSGDLYPLFNTAGYVAQYPVRDSDDIVHSALMMDLWTSFARSGNPNPPAQYLSIRGYTSTANRLTGSGWTATTSSSLNLLSLGPYPGMQSLGIRGPQCTALSLPINYISQGK